MNDLYYWDAWMLESLDAWPDIGERTEKRCRKSVDHIHVMLGLLDAWNIENIWDA